MWCITSRMRSSVTDQNFLDTHAGAGVKTGLGDAHDYVHMVRGLRRVRYSWNFGAVYSWGLFRSR